jgi:sarcosine oxidase subunit gamma
MTRGALWLEQAEAPRRFGVKGPRAAELLQQLGFTVPHRPNTWEPLRAQEQDDSPNLIARLGNTEFFIEELAEAPGIAALERQIRAGSTGAYPVQREDTGILLGGARACDALAEVCNVNFAALPMAQKPAVMTLMTGVAVLVLPRVTAAGTVYRIWCDPSFGPYLWETLAEVVSNNGRAE